MCVHPFPGASNHVIAGCLCRRACALRAMTRYAGRPAASTRRREWHAWAQLMAGVRAVTGHRVTYIWIAHEAS
jgi:hypothetical protein